ncbi:hypothetical protein HC766_05460 [Candidatus Gracilibacteria bacterium]|nr:hypothetical protein [Candidatus Gracilibacteria bacterium]NJS41756.1 hypothetical protein [Candidatus Gracilibacteria bacterium]
MQIDQKSKQRLLAYVKKNQNKTSNLSTQESLNAFDWLIDDIFIKSQGLLQVDEIEEFIISSAIRSLEKSLNQEDTEFVRSQKEPEALFEIIIELLEDEEQLATFIIGAVFGYSVLCSKLKIQPNESYLSLVNIAMS